MLFEADPEYIASLDGMSLVRLMKRLLLAESRLAGIALRSAAVPLQVTVTDGGEDGRAEWTGGLDTTAYFPHRFTLFQSKAQNLTESRVKAEILKKAKKGPAKLSPAIVEVLAKGGAYIIFCREKMMTSKRDKLVRAIKAAIVAGGENPKRAAAIAVYDANLIADWVNTHRAAALWLASQRMGRNLGGFQTHEAWGRSSDINSVPWQPSDDPRFAPANRTVPAKERKDSARNALTFDQASNNVLEFLGNDRAIVRIFGPSGFGKSRFVYEALGRQRSIADDIDTACVIHCDASISGEEAVKLALELANAGLPAILVVDECPDELHLKLANFVKRTSSRLRLVSIDIETKVLQAADTLSIRVERADNSLIQEIAIGVAPNLSEADSRFIADLAEGFPRMAVLAAQQEGGSRQMLESAEQILERIIWSGKPRVQDAQRALEIASLFEWFGIQGRVEDQADFLAAELAQMPLSHFVEHLLSFKPRGIITQRGDFLQIGPVPLAARLANARLSVMTAELLVRFFQKAPHELKWSFLKRIKWADTSPIAAAFAERLLEPDLMGNFATLNTEFGSKLLDQLVHIVPDTASATIDRVFGNLTLDELKAARDGRRYLVWALEKLVFRTQTFNRSARLLRRLAVAENEDISNSASGVFRQLFQLYLSGTEAEPSARLLVLDEGLSSANSNERAVCVDALGHMLDSGHFSRSGGSEQIGSADALQDWQPKTYGEIWNFYRAAISRLVPIAISDDPLSESAKALLGSHIRGLLHQLPTKEVRALIDTITARLGFWPEALSGISRWLYFDRTKHQSLKVAAEIRAMFDEFLPSDPIDLATFYTRGWQADLHDPDTQYDPTPNAKHDFEYASRQAVLVAQQIAKDEELVSRAVERLACSHGNNLFPFARELARSVNDPKALFAYAVRVAEASITQPHRAFFGGLIAGADERDTNLAKEFVRIALQSSKLKDDAVTLIGSGRLQAEDIALVTSLLQTGDVKSWQCQNLGLFRLDLAIFFPLLEELENHGSDGLWTIVDIVSMYLYGEKNQPTKELIRLIKRVLVSPQLLQTARNNMDGYYLEQMVDRLVKLGAVTEGYTKRLAKQVLSICRQGSSRVFYPLADPVRKVLGALIALHPDLVWDEIAKKLTSKSWHVRFYAEHLLEATNRDDHLARGLAFAVPAKQYLDWVRAKPEARASSAVAWLPIVEKNEDGSLRWHGELEHFVGEFGDQPNVLAAISARLRPTSWVGGLSGYLEPAVPLVQTWSTHPNPNVRSWVATTLDWLTVKIKEESKREEEDVVR